MVYEKEVLSGERADICTYARSSTTAVRLVCYCVYLRGASISASARCWRLGRGVFGQLSVKLVSMMSGFVGAARDLGAKGLGTLV